MNSCMSLYVPRKGMKQDKASIYDRRIYMLIVDINGLVGVFWIMSDL